MDQRKEQRVCIKFCANLGKSATETLKMIQQGLGNQSLSRTQVLQWHARFKTGRTLVDGDEHTGRPTSCTTPWNSWTNSTVHPSGSTSDHSRHCWGGGSWVWDMPTGSDGRIGHAPCRSQIYAQDPDSWPDAAARQLLHWTSSARLRRWTVLVQGHHWWRELGLRLRLWDKATTLPVEKLQFTKAKKGQTGKKQSQEHDHHFLWHQGDCAQRICPSRPKCKFRVLLRSFAATAWKGASSTGVRWRLIYRILKKENIRDCICFRLIRIGPVEGGGDSCVRRNKTSVFYFKKVEFLDMSHDCRLFNNDLHIVHENRNKFDLIGAKVHSIHNLLQTIFFLLCSICWNKYCELFSCADHE